MLSEKLSGMFNPDPGSGSPPPIPDPDPGVKKTPDPRYGYATLVFPKKDVGLWAFEGT
jgi:hypothetical protein